MTEWNIILSEFFSEIYKSFAYLWQLKCLFIFKEVSAEVCLHQFLTYLIYMGSKTH